MTDRELDALVAEKVMGWTLVKGDRERGSPIANELGGLAGMMCGTIPRYSTTGDGMLAVIEAMHKRGWSCSAEGPDLFGGCWAEFSQMEGKMMRGPDGDADSLPRAVCLAALQALGWEEKP